MSNYIAPDAAETRGQDDLPRLRRTLVLQQARLEGLVGEEKDARISGRVRQSLIDAAKSRAQVQSDTELIEYALAKVALEDDFGARLVERKGTVSKDIDLEI